MFEYHMKGLFFNWKKEKVSLTYYVKHTVFIQLRAHWFKRDVGYYDAIDYSTITICGICFGKTKTWEQIGVF